MQALTGRAAELYQNFLDFKESATGQEKVLLESSLKQSYYDINHEDDEFIVNYIKLNFLIDSSRNFVMFLFVCLDLYTLSTMYDKREILYKGMTNIIETIYED